MLRSILWQRIRFVLLACSLVPLAASCSSGPSSLNPPAKPSYTVPEQITLTAAAIRNSKDGTVITGTTNLPDGTKLGIELIPKGKLEVAPMLVEDDLDVFVNSGEFHSRSFSAATYKEYNAALDSAVKAGTITEAEATRVRKKEVEEAPLPPGKQKVRIFTYFTKMWQTQEILDIVGEGGSKLKSSAIIRLEDAQLIDSDKVLDYTADLVIPPLVNTPAKVEQKSSDSTAESKAIKTVKNAVLIVNGSRSSMNVNDGFEWYCSLGMGTSVGDGWSAKKIGNDTYRVSLDFLNKVAGNWQHDKAIWDVNLRTKKVLYRNMYSKGFSWIPSK